MGEVLADHPIVKLLLVAAGLFSIVFAFAQYQWHQMDERQAQMENEWLELDRGWNADIISRLQRLESICGGDRRP